MKKDYRGCVSLQNSNLKKTVVSLFSPATKLIFISQVKKKPFQSTICVLLFHKIILNRQTVFQIINYAKISPN